MRDSHNTKWETEPVWKHIGGVKALPSVSGDLKKLWFLDLWWPFGIYSWISFICMTTEGVGLTFEFSLSTIKVYIMLKYQRLLWISTLSMKKTNRVKEKKTWRRGTTRSVAQRWESHCTKKKQSRFSCIYGLLPTVMYIKNVI